MDLFFTVTGFPVLDNFFLQLQGWVSVLRRFSGHSIFSQIQPFSGTLAENGFQPNPAIFSQNSAIFSQIQPFSAKFSHFQPFSAKNMANFSAGNDWIWLNFWLKMAEFWLKTAEFWLNLAESGWNARERGKERPWSLQNWLPEILRITVPKNQNEIIKITVTDFGKNGNN